MASSGSTPVRNEPEVHSTATVLVNTEAMPNAPPAPVARTTLRRTGRRSVRANTTSTPTAPNVTEASSTCSGPSSVCGSASPVSASSPPSPAVAINAPRQAVAPARRPTNRAASGRANTIVSAPSGWTRLSGP